MKLPGKQFFSSASPVIFYILFFNVHQAFSQPLEKKVFLKIDPINAFTESGTKTIYSKSASGPLAESLTPRLEIIDAPDGFFIRTDFHVSKYDDNLILIWQADLKKNFTLQSQPYDVMLGDQQNYYFIEYASSGDLSFNKVDEKGHLFETEIENSRGQPFILDHQLCLLKSDINKKLKKFSTSLIQVDYSKGTTASIDVPLEYNDYEYTAETVDKNLSYHRWSAFSQLANGHELLKKVYFKDIQESRKKKDLIIETVEIDSKGKIYNHLKWNFEAKLIDDDRKFMVPTLAFDNVNNELIILGYMSIDRENLNGLYLLKFDYNSKDLLYSKEYAFSEILKSTDIKKTHSSIPKAVGTVVPLKLTSNDYYFNKKDKIFSLQIITNYRGTATTYYEVKFDKYGDHVQTDLVEYRSFNFKYPDHMKSMPVFHEVLFKDTTRPHFIKAGTTAEDFIINHAEKNKSEVYTFPINRDDYSIIIYYDEGKGEFSAVKN